MRRIDRVMTAIAGRREPDRVPWGELAIEPEAGRRLLGALGRPCTGRGSGGLGFQEEVDLLDALGMDLAPVSAGAGDPFFEKRIERHRIETDRFVMFVTGGGFYDCMHAMGFQRFLTGLRTGSTEVGDRIAQTVRRNTALALRAVASGAHGVMVADDIAYSRSTYASPRDLRAVLFPRLREMAAVIRDAGCVPMFHSDGNLAAVFEDIVSLGFQVIHSLEPSAGMDLAPRPS